MEPIGEFAGFAGNVAFGKSGDTDGKTILFADEPHELAGIFETTRGDLKVTAIGRVAAEREHVFYAEGTDLPQQIADLFFRGRDAGQVRHRSKAMLPLDTVYNHQRFVASASPCAVGDGTIIGFGLAQSRDGFFEQIAVAFVRLWRKKLERNHRLPSGGFGGVYITDKLHGSKMG